MQNCFYFNENQKALTTVKKYGLKFSFAPDEQKTFYYNTVISNNSMQKCC